MYKRYVISKRLGGSPPPKYFHCPTFAETRGPEAINDPWSGNIYNADRHIMKRNAENAIVKLPKGIYQIETIYINE